MLGPAFIFVAIALRLVAGASYFVAAVRGSVQPNPVTWLFWGLSPLLAFAAQLGSLQPTSWVTLGLAIGPLLIFTVSLTKSRKQRWRLDAFDKLCGASAAIGLLLWQLTSDPLLALVFSILADILGGLPTVHKAYLRPDTERALPYFISMMSMIVTLLTIKEWHFISAAFPVYILIINTIIAGLVWSQFGPKFRRLTRRLLSETRP